ncbi:hypothetical protein H7J07_05655 [Mycobacterium koreense]|uniref:Uncharacterized protein n=1 Tax=Mycolicibacillus koreensis TaxID=1069220 RepID=A0A7I7SDQ7_9MYCO|nr:hypothetical protein [Mycolicibacillus koreensis]MCV7247710.1 hypothetical protein [Mycolicibacillus koreensis]OSC34757.1 hypothetical protein B8W67_05785 [Mycolicibacillus koreensis]BBY54095.1 hypothetical protein MKOR_13460 [Mycolicibacillus koreensis]
MALDVTIRLHNNTFRGRAGDPDTTAWPPSPARLIGALLAGAHALRPVHGEPDALADSAVAAVEALTAAPLPAVVTGSEPVEMAGNTAWFTTKSPWTVKLAEKDRSGKEATPAELASVIEPVHSVDARNKVVKSRTLSLLTGSNVIRYLIDTEVPGPSLAALRSAAELIGHFGSATDIATVTVADHRAGLDELTAQVDADETVWVPERSGAAGVLVRGWTPATVSFYDDMFADGGAALRGDPRVPMVRYRPIGPPPPPLPSLIVRPFTGGVRSMKEFPAIYAQTAELLDGLDVDVHPALDRNREGRVRGLILGGADRDEAVVRLDGLLDPDVADGYAALDPDTWSGPSRQWESVTSLVAHHDPFIARGEVEVFLSDVGLRLAAMTASPWKQFQSPAHGIGAGYRHWYVTATSDEPLAGPIRAGRFPETGAGLLAPVRGRRTHATAT